MRPVFHGGEPGRVVPCRDCARPTPISAYAIGLAQYFASGLEMRGEDPLREDELTLCNSCRILQAERESTARKAELAKARRAGAQGRAGTRPGGKP